MAEHSSGHADAWTATDDAEPGAVQAAAVEALNKVVAHMGAGGEDRAGQRVMCEAVADAASTGRHLIVAAGTGTGKSMGYIVPVVTSGKTAVIATATKALQDQLVNKDLPSLAAALGRDIRFAVLKGRANYICKQKLHDRNDTQAGLFAVADDAATGWGLNELDRIAHWATTTPDGDRAGLSFEPSPRAWEAVSTSGRECPGAAECPSGDVCFAERAKKAAAAADIVVTNTHLYCLDALTGAPILPEHDIAVFDEAHVIEDIAANAAGVQITAGRFGHAARAVKAATPGRSTTADGVTEAGDILAETLRTHLGGLLPATVPDDLVGAAVLCRARLCDADNTIVDSTGDETRMLLARRLIAALVEDLDAAVADTGNAAWVEGTDSNPVWRTAPVDVGPVLATNLWEQTPAVLTSATVPAGLADTLGIDADSCDELDVGSPFEYRKNGLLYCPKHLPGPNIAGRDKHAHEETAALIRAAGGRTLALYTSYAALERAVEAVRSLVDQTVYAQGDYPKAELLRRFADEEESCLFATMSMWQGVDVPGRSLSCVIVDRIPFPRPNDPLMSARREQHGNQAFVKIDVPRAATMLAQGVGRLIRTGTDRGVVAVLDSRLATARSYRWMLLRALPDYARTSSLADATGFLTAIRDNADTEAA